MGGSPKDHKVKFVESTKDGFITNRDAVNMFFSKLGIPTDSSYSTYL